MTTTNVTISLEETDLDAARTLAKEAGLSFSAYIARCARHEQMRINGRKYREYMASLTGEDAEARDAWDQHVAEQFARAAEPAAPAA